MKLYGKNHLALGLALAFQLAMARGAHGHQVAKAVGDAVVDKQAERFDVVHVKLLAIVGLGNAALGASVTVAGACPVALSVPVRAAFVADSSTPKMALISRPGVIGTTLGTIDALAVLSGLSDEKSLSLKRYAAAIADEIEGLLTGDAGALRRTKAPAASVWQVGCTTPIARSRPPLNSGPMLRDALAFSATAPTGRSAQGDDKRDAAAFACLGLPGVLGVSAHHRTKAGRFRCGAAVRDLPASLAWEVFVDWHGQNIAILFDWCNGWFETIREGRLLEGVPR